MYVCLAWGKFARHGIPRMTGLESGRGSLVLFRFFLCMWRNAMGVENVFTGLRMGVGLV